MIFKQINKQITKTKKIIPVFGAKSYKCNQPPHATRRGWDPPSAAGTSAGRPSPLRGRSSPSAARHTHPPPLPARGAEGTPSAGAAGRARGCPGCARAGVTWWAPRRGVGGTGNGSSSSRNGRRSRQRDGGGAAAPLRGRAPRRAPDGAEMSPGAARHSRSR